MPDRPLVSVVTPTLNQAHFLEPTLRSVRLQTYPNIEHIVVDGGSTDGTIEILRRAANPDPADGDAMVGRPNGALQWQSGPDRGMYDAINKGLALARGEILAYLNSDDAWMPWAVQEVMRVFESKPDVDLVFGDGIKVYQETGVQRLRLFSPFDRVSLANYESLMQPAVFWRRRLTDRLGGFDTELRFVGDLDYWLRAAAAGAKIAHVNEVIAIERIHEGRLSTSQREAMALEDQQMRAKHAGDHGGPEGRERAKARDMRWQQIVWFEFLMAARARWLPIPWRRFLRRGRLIIRRRRAYEGSKPYQSKKLNNAVISRLALAVLEGTSEALPPPPPLRRRMRRRAGRVLRPLLVRLGLRKPRSRKRGWARQGLRGPAVQAPARATAPGSDRGTAA